MTWDPNPTPLELWACVAGWFQSSLQTAAAVGEAAPYRTLVTHGFVLDPHKQKMSKSVGNVVDPDVVIHGGRCVAFRFRPAYPWGSV